MERTIATIASEAKAATRAMALASTDKKNAMLASLASCIESQKSSVFAANQLDCAAGREAGLSPAMIDRLTLNEDRVAKMVEGIRQVISLDDPVGTTDRRWTNDAGLDISRVRVPIGVIGIIYESRPNVTVDASILCVKSGNVTILRGGKEAFETNKALVGLIQNAARDVGLPESVVSFVPTTDRTAITELCHMSGQIDLMIPRGGKGLIETVTREARMPVIKHYEGICHIYVHQDADFEMARKIILNAKCQRPGVCNAVETVLIDETIREQFHPLFERDMREAGVELRYEPESWGKEYLDLILAVRFVSGMGEAVDHIEQYGSHHSDAIITANEAAARTFLAEVDSAAVYWNASTRFTDGYAFGMGAEIGISTEKVHARGPMALEELTSYKYMVCGTGQVRS